MRALHDNLKPDAARPAITRIMLDENVRADWIDGAWIAVELPAQPVMPMWSALRLPPHDPAIHRPLREQERQALADKLGQLQGHRIPQPALN